MIALLRGRLVSRGPGRGVVDVRGVGYAVAATERALDDWAGGEEVEVHVSTQVREDAIALYGFTTPAARDGFETLLSVGGVGPKLALACLEVLTVGQLARAVELEDVRALSQVPGVGKKTARRLALELKGKLPVGPGDVQGPATRPAAATDTLSLALERLGYSRAEIDRVLVELPSRGVDHEAPIQTRLKAALKILYGN